MIGRGRLARGCRAERRLAGLEGFAAWVATLTLVCPGHSAVYTSVTSSLKPVIRVQCPCIKLSVVRSARSAGRAGRAALPSCATLWYAPGRMASARATGDWLSGRAPRSHRGGHWFDPSIAHHRLRAGGLQVANRVQSLSSPAAPASCAAATSRPDQGDPVDGRGLGESERAGCSRSTSRGIHGDDSCATESGAGTVRLRPRPAPG